MERAFAGLVALGRVAAFAALPVSAQTPPSDAEIRNYIGLQTDGWRGDLAAIGRLVAAGA